MTNKSTNIKIGLDFSTFFQARPADTEATCLTVLSPSICDYKDNIQGWCGLQESVSCLLDKKDDMD